MQESWSFHAAQNKHAKSFYPQQNMYLPVCNHWTGICRSRTQLILPLTEFCPGQSKASSDCSLEHLPQQAGDAGSRGVEAADHFLVFLDWQRLSMPFSWERVTQLCHLAFQAMLSQSAECVVIQAHDSQGTCQKETKSLLGEREVGWIVFVFVSVCLTHF